jgi:hypothetical protein
MSSADRSIPPGPVALIDLGDTLCECTPALRAVLARRRRSGEPNEDESQLAAPHLEARRREVLCAPGFWRGLAPRASGFSLLQLVRECGFLVYVLTKGPDDAPWVWGDKVSWCRAHLPGVGVIVTDDKSRVHGDVLVDDWLPYVESWQRQWPKGLAIVPAQPWNAQVQEGPSLLRDAGENRDQIRAALLRCRGAAGSERAGPARR